MGHYFLDTRYYIKWVTTSWTHSSSAKNEWQTLYYARVDSRRHTENDPYNFSLVYERVTRRIKKSRLGTTEPL